eukprot:sb/3460746/
MEEKRLAEYEPIPSPDNGPLLFITDLKDRFEDWLGEVGCTSDTVSEDGGGLMAVCQVTRTYSPDNSQEGEEGEKGSEGFELVDQLTCAHVDTVSVDSEEGTVQHRSPQHLPEEGATPTPQNNSGATPIPQNSSEATPTPQNNSEATPTPQNNSEATPTPQNNSGATPTPQNNSEATPTPQNSSGTTPTPQNNSGATPTPQNNSEATPTPQNSSGTTPTPQNNSEATPTPQNSSGTTPTPQNNSGATPTPQNNLAASSTPQNATHSVSDNNPRVVVPLPITTPPPIDIAPQEHLEPSAPPISPKQVVGNLNNSPVPLRVDVFEEVEHDGPPSRPTSQPGNSTKDLSHDDLMNLKGTRRGRGTKSRSSGKEKPKQEKPKPKSKFDLSSLNLPEVDIKAEEKPEPVLEMPTLVEDMEEKRLAEYEPIPSPDNGPLLFITDLKDRFEDWLGEVGCTSDTVSEDGGGLMAVCQVTRTYSPDNSQEGGEEGEKGSEGFELVDQLTCAHVDTVSVDSEEGTVQHRSPQHLPEEEGATRTPQNNSGATPTPQNSSEATPTPQNNSGATPTLQNNSGATPTPQNNFVASSPPQNATHSVSDNNPRGMVPLPITTPPPFDIAPQEHLEPPAPPISPRQVVGNLNNSPVPLRVDVFEEVEHDGPPSRPTSQPGNSTKDLSHDDLMNLKGTRRGRGTKSRSSSGNEKSKPKPKSKFDLSSLNLPEVDTKDEEKPEPVSGEEMPKETVKSALAEPSEPPLESDQAIEKQRIQRALPASLPPRENRGIERIQGTTVKRTPPSAAAVVDEGKQKAVENRKTSQSPSNSQPVSSAQEQKKTRPPTGKQPVKRAGRSREPSLEQIPESKKEEMRQEPVALIPKQEKELARQKERETIKKTSAPPRRVDPLKQHPPRPEVAPITSDTDPVVKQSPPMTKRENVSVAQKSVVKPERVSVKPIKPARRKSGLSGSSSSSYSETTDSSLTSPSYTSSVTTEESPLSPPAASTASSRSSVVPAKPKRVSPPLTPPAPSTRKPVLIEPARKKPELMEDSHFAADKPRHTQYPEVTVKSPPVPPTADSEKSAGVSEKSAGDSEKSATVSEKSAAVSEKSAPVSEKLPSIRTPPLQDEAREHSTSSTYESVPSTKSPEEPRKKNSFFSVSRLLSNSPTKDKSKENAKPGKTKGGFFNFVKSMLELKDTTPPPQTPPRTPTPPPPPDPVEPEVRERKISIVQYMIPPSDIEIRHGPDSPGWESPDKTHLQRQRQPSTDSSPDIDHILFALVSSPDSDVSKVVRSVDPPKKQNHSAQQQEFLTTSSCPPNIFSLPCLLNHSSAELPSNRHTAQPPPAQLETQLERSPQLGTQLERSSQVSSEFSCFSRTNSYFDQFFLHTAAAPTATVPHSPSPSLPGPIVAGEPGSVPKEGEVPLVGGRYRLLEQIGEGGFGVVYLGTDTHYRDTAVVLKEMREVIIEELTEEITILQNYPHEHIMELWDHFTHETTHVLVFDFRSRLTLFEYLRGVRCGLTEGECRVIVRQVISALEWLHGNMIVHGDIKDENLIIEPARMFVTLIDFGSARILEDEFEPMAFRGTRVYSPPEFILTEVAYGLSLDVWTIGVLVYVILSNRRPFPNEDQILMACLPYRREWSESVRDLLRKCLAKDFSERPAVRDLIHHPWVYVN